MDEANRYLALIEGVISEHGWAVQGVNPDDGPAFAYSVGLERRGLPEILITGLTMNVAQTFINMVAKRAIDHPEMLEVGVPLYGIAENGVPCMLLELEDSSSTLLIANALRAGEHAVRALQLVFPDADGLWPWQPGSALAYMPIRGQVPGHLT